MHDGAHGGYSKNKTINYIMGFTLDLMGGSQMLWRPKHNILHHTYTNLDELDTDLETHGLLRLSPGQKWRSFHRYQHWYAFILYSFMSLSWVFYSDFAKFSKGYIGNYKLPRFSNWDVALFFLTKILYLGYMLVLPSFFHPLSHVLVGFVLIHMIFSCCLALLFQLAHTVEGTTFPKPDSSSGTFEQEWARHQVETTVNFAPSSKWAAWAFGGLNYQIEHHIFPRLSHIHYPTISTIVEATCREFGLAYTSYPSVGAAILAHFRFLQKMGKQPTETTV